MTLASEILRSARIAELRAAAQETSRLVRPARPVSLPRAPAAQRRRLLLMLRWERQRNAKLVEALYG